MLKLIKIAKLKALRSKWSSTQHVFSAPNSRSRTLCRTRDGHESDQNHHHRSVR